MILLHTSPSLSLAAQELAVCIVQFQKQHFAPNCEAFLPDSKHTVHAILPYLPSEDRKVFLCLDCQFDHVVLVVENY